jgi:TetR/AcrR family transcriptional regulator, fatty acid metabolism regulator protein
VAEKAEEMDPDLRKKHILTCAKKLFSKNGYYETQISDIVEEADIARGTIYQYFENKEGIFTTLIDGFYTQWEKMVSIGSAGIDLQNIDPVDYLKHRVKMTLVFFKSDPELCNIMLKMGQGLSQQFDMNMKRFEKKIINLITRDLELGVRNGNVRKDINIDLAVSLLGGAIMRVAYDFFVVKRRERADFDVDRIADEIASIYTNGIFVKK